MKNNDSDIKEETWEGEKKMVEMSKHKTNIEKIIENVLKAVLNKRNL